MKIDAKLPISQYFTFKEALWLPRWDRLANESDGLTEEVITTLKYVFAKMDLIRGFFGLPITVTIAYRPEEYNKLIGGAKNSAHMAKQLNIGAVDFVVKGLDANTVRDRLKPKLEEFGIRMEDINGNWIHIDTRAPGPSGRFFKP